MSVRDRLDDAGALLQLGRHAGALLSICAAISATSMKRYPESEVKGDREAFTRFLGDEMRVVTKGGVVNFFVGCQSVRRPNQYSDGMMPLQDVLYEFVRCSLSHDAQIADRVEILTDGRFSCAVQPDRIVLGGGLIGGLIRVVEFAPENSHEFPGIARLPIDVAGWMLFAESRGNHSEYLQHREACVRQTTHHMS